MDWETIKSKVTAASRQQQKTVDIVLDVFSKELADAFAAGESVMLPEELGMLKVQLTETKLNENSPRRPKKPEYRILFQPSVELRKKLRMGDEEYEKYLDEYKNIHMRCAVREKSKGH